MVGRGYREGKMGMMANEHKVYLGGNVTALKLDTVESYHHQHNSMNILKKTLYCTL